MNIAVIGLGKLGCPLLAVAAHRGHDVIGVDVDDALVQAIGRGETSIDETRLQETLAEAWGDGNVSATTDLGYAIARSSLVFVVVPTPSDQTGGFSSAYVEALGLAIGTQLKSCDKKYRVFILVSTVMPEQTQKDFVDGIARASEIECGDGYGVCYSPTFIALGSVISDLLRPDLLLIGESDNRAGEALEEFYVHTFCENSPTVVRTNFTNAEVAKLALNCFVTTKISYANMISELCENLPRGDARVVMAAIGTDSRIGRKFLKPGTAYGGPCLPRDNTALIVAAKKVGVFFDIAEATDNINDRQVLRLFSLVKSHVQEDRSVGILGLTYKPDTGVTECSAGTALARLLVKGENPITVYDPRADWSIEGVDVAASIGECVRSSQAIVIATPWPEFADLDICDLMPSQYGPKLLVDCWGMYANNDTIKAIVEYVCLGVSRQ